MKNKKLMLIALMQQEREREKFNEALKSVCLHVNVQYANNKQQLIELIGNEKRVPTNKLPIMIVAVCELREPSTINLISSLKNCQKPYKIPTIIVSRYHTSEQVKLAYKLGVTSVIKHPTRFDSLVEIMKILDDYWLSIVSLPRVTI